jgi:hypothetical protein
MKGTKTTIRPLDWHCASPFGHDPPWPSPCSTSACVASSALLCRVGEASRTKTSRSWCSDIRFVFSNANSTGACGIDQQIGRSSRHSAACSQGHVAILPGNSRDAAAVASGISQGQVAAMESTGRHRPTADGSPHGRTHHSSGSREPALGMYPHPGRVAKARDPRFPAPFVGSCAEMVSDRCHEVDLRGRSSFAPRHRACWQQTSSRWIPSG